MSKTSVLLVLSLLTLCAFILLLRYSRREVEAPAWMREQFETLDNNRFQVVVTTRDRLYHLSNCPNLSEADTMRMMLKDAILDYYGPCPVCLGKRARDVNPLELAAHENTDEYDSK